MASMMAAAVSAALAMYVVVQAARGIGASLRLADAAEDQMVMREHRDGVFICASAIALCLYFAAFACYVALVPGAAASMEVWSEGRQVALTLGGLAVTAASVHQTLRLCRADSDSALYRQREVPATYAALVWSALGLNYSIALA